MPAERPSPPAGADDDGVRRRRRAALAAGRGPTPAVSLSPDVAAARGIRVLDPVTATRLPGQRAPNSTPYVGDVLLLPGLPGRGSEEHLARVKQAAGRRGVTVTPDPVPPRAGPPDQRPDR